MNTLIVGPMYGGKSTALLQKMERYIYAKKRICFIRPKIDNRGYITHNGINSIKAKLAESDKTFEIEEFTLSFVNSLESFDAVFIDEYFMIKNCDLVCKNTVHPDIYFAGLLATSENTLFEEAIKILPYCDEIIKLNGVCMGIDNTPCGSQLGNYSGYFGKNKLGQIEVGDKLYKCLCKECYKKAFGKL